MPYVPPNPHILNSLQSQSLSWWKRLAELIDNSLDAGAKQVRLSFRGSKLTVMYDGSGVPDMTAVIRLGESVETGSARLGRFGIGAKDAWLTTGHVIEIVSVYRGVRKSLTVDVRQWIKSNWQIPDVIEEPSSDPSGTTIRISIKDGKAPDWRQLQDRLGWVFGPALKAGIQIINIDKKSPLTAYEMPTLSDVVKDRFEIHGKAVAIEIGMLPPGVKVSFGPFWIQYRHRAIDQSCIGSKGRGGERVAGIITLGDGWHLSKNKDDFFGERDAMDDAIYARIEGLLAQCEEAAEEVETNVLRQELEGLFKAAFGNTRREKRDTNGGSCGTREPRHTGIRRRTAAQSTNNPGSVDGDGTTGAPRHGFHLRFRSDSSGRLGRFDASGKTINLNPDNPAIAELKAAKNKSGLLVIACAIIADHNAENDGTQKLMPYGKGDFIGPYTSLVTSLIKPEAKSDV